MDLPNYPPLAKQTWMQRAQTAIDVASEALDEGRATPERVISHLAHNLLVTCRELDKAYAVLRKIRDGG